MCIFGLFQFSVLLLTFIFICGRFPEFSNINYDILRIRVYKYNSCIISSHIHAWYFGPLNRNLKDIVAVVNILSYNNLSKCLTNLTTTTYSKINISISTPITNFYQIWSGFCLNIIRIFSCGLNWDPQTLPNEKSFCIYPVTNRVLSCGQHGIASCNTTWFPAEPAH